MQSTILRLTTLPPPKEFNIKNLKISGEKKRQLASFKKEQKSNYKQHAQKIPCFSNMQVLC